MIFKGTVTAEQANQIRRNFSDMKLGELNGNYYQIVGIKSQTTPDRIEMEVRVMLIHYVPDNAEFRCTLDELLRGLEPVIPPERFERRAARRAIARMETDRQDRRNRGRHAEVSGLTIAIQILREEMGIND